MFRFAAPWLLLLLPLAPLAGWMLWRRRRLADARVTLPRIGLGIRQLTNAWVRLERNLPWLRVVALALLIASLARPQSGSKIETVSTFGVDIVVALDISGSMRAEDFRQDHRLGVALKTVERFVEGRGPDRIGLVVFAALATTRCPLTLDHEMLSQFLEEVDFAPRDQNGTALGMGLATAVNRLRGSDARSKVVVLLTDGRNNAGQIGPRAAAEAARALGIKVYTVGVGSEGQAPVLVDRGPLAGRYMMQALDLDEELLQEIAAKTDGHYFRATDSEGLQQVFETIDSLEKTKIESRIRILYAELFGWTLTPAVLLLLLERLLLATRLGRLP